MTKKTDLTKITRDKRGNIYEVIQNIRITYIKSQSRDLDKNWADCDVLRIQSYKEPETNLSLHAGAEIPLENNETILDLIETLCRLYKKTK